MSQPDLTFVTPNKMVADRWIGDEFGVVRLAALQRHSSLDADTERFRGRCVLLLSEAQLPSVLATIELDGVARRILLCPPDLAPSHLDAIIEDAEVDFIITDNPAAAVGANVPVIACHRQPSIPRARDSLHDATTEWVLFTSGTTGRPKMVVHTLASLCGPITDGAPRPTGAIWSTFYDVRRYGGLQILLRALAGGGSMVLSGVREGVGDFLKRVAAAKVTHISGTPSHWRRALMSPTIRRINPAYVRLSGEAADQAILDRLRAAFPAAGLAHAFASTEAGVAFEVRDMRAGFPAAYLDSDGPSGQRAELRVVDGVLCIRSDRVASRYLGATTRQLADSDGFVATGDLVEKRGDRLYFVGRREGVINVGGQKVYPEEVEAVINQHPDVRMSRVRGRTSPVTGAIVAAEIVLKPDAARPSERITPIRDEIVRTCRAALAAHKVPVTLKMVPSLEISASGKLARVHA